MKTDAEREDIPKIVASIMVMIPALVFGSGIAYLRMRRSAHRSAKLMRKNMVAGGVPDHYAKKLSEKYASDLSIRHLMKNLSPPSMRSW